VQAYIDEGRAYMCVARLLVGGCLPTFSLLSCGVVCVYVCVCELMCMCQGACASCTSSSLPFDLGFGSLLDKDM